MISLKRIAISALVAGSWMGCGDNSSEPSTDASANLAELEAMAVNNAASPHATEDCKAMFGALTKAFNMLVKGSKKSSQWSADSKSGISADGSLLHNLTAGVAPTDSTVCAAIVGPVSAFVDTAVAKTANATNGYLTEAELKVTLSVIASVVRNTNVADLMDHIRSIRSQLASLYKLVALDIKTGKPSAAFQAVIDFITSKGVAVEYKAALAVANAAFADAGTNQTAVMKNVLEMTNDLVIAARGKKTAKTAKVYVNIAVRIVKWMISQSKDSETFTTGFNQLMATVENSKWQAEIPVSLGIMFTSLGQNPTFVASLIELVVDIADARSKSVSPETILLAQSLLKDILVAAGATSLLPAATQAELLAKLTSMIASFRTTVVAPSIAA